MIERGLLLLMLVLLASCVPAATARHAEPDPSDLTLDAVRHLPVARIPAVIDAVTAPGVAAQPFEAGGEATGLALDCLTAAVYYEARSESPDGQRAVAQVVLNRVRHPAFPRSVCGVVFQGRERRTGCQFSFTCDGSMNRPREPVAWARAREIAEAALAGYVYAPVGLATHFHTTAIHPWWAPAMRRAVTVGAHIFYRWPGQWGDPMAFRRAYQGFEGGLPVAGVATMPSRGVEMAKGVTIHRSAASPVREASVEPPRRQLVNGVRVHRGGDSRVDVHTAPEIDVALSDTNAGEVAAVTR